MRNVEISKINKYEDKSPRALLGILRRKLIILKKADLIGHDVDLTPRNKHNALEIADRLVKDDEFWEAAPEAIYIGTSKEDSREKIYQPKEYIRKTLRILTDMLFDDRERGAV